MDVKETLDTTMDKAKDAAEEMVDKAKDMAEDAADKAKNFAEVTKLNHQISQCESRMRDVYVEIGKKFYEENKNNPSEEYEGLFVQIANENMNIANIRAQVSRIKGVIYCPSCGAENSAENIFCCKCGAGGIRPADPEPETVDPSDITVEVVKPEDGETGNG